MSKITKRKKVSRKQPRLSSSHPLYGCWSSMLDRCTNERSQAWAAYGGRGITVCPEWVASFAQFVEDMGPKPSPSHHLDRRDNNAGYSAANCHWVSPRDSARNRRHAIKVITASGVKNVGDAADDMGINRSTVYARTGKGYAPAQALLVGKNVHRTMAAKHGNPVLKSKTIKACATEAGVPYVSLVRLMNAGATLEDAIAELRGNQQRKADRKRNRASGIERLPRGELARAASRLGMTPAAILGRIADGWSITDAISTPKGQRPAVDMKKAA
jgi:hypothetical protein